MAKRARELAVKERRERKRAKKAEAAAERAAAKAAPPGDAGLDGSLVATDAEEGSERPTSAAPRVSPSPVSTEGDLGEADS